MIMIPLENDKQTISNRFRKADNFVLIDDNDMRVLKNSHKQSKSNEFFDFFKTLNVDTIYLKNIGLKTFNKLYDMKIDVYIIDEDKISNLGTANKTKLNLENIKDFATLGH